MNKKYLQPSIPLLQHLLFLLLILACLYPFKQLGFFENLNYFIAFIATSIILHGLNIKKRYIYLILLPLLLISIYDDGFRHVSFFSNWFFSFVDLCVDSVEAILAREWHNVSPVFLTLISFLISQCWIVVFYFWIKKRLNMYLIVISAFTVMIAADFHLAYEKIHWVFLAVFIIGILMIALSKLHDAAEIHGKMPRQVWITWAAALCLLLAIGTTIGGLSPKFGSQWASPFQLDGGNGDDSGTGRVNKQGYREDDSELGGDLEADDALVFTARVTNSSYWKVENRNTYNGKGWDWDGFESVDLYTSTANKEDNTQEEYAQIKLEQPFEYIPIPSPQQSFAILHSTEEEGAYITPSIDRFQIGEVRQQTQNFYHVYIREDVWEEEERKRKELEEDIDWEDEDSVDGWNAYWEASLYSEIETELDRLEIELNGDVYPLSEYVVLDENGYISQRDDMDMIWLAYGLDIPDINEPILLADGELFRIEHTDKLSLPEPFSYYSPYEKVEIRYQAPTYKEEDLKAIKLPEEPNIDEIKQYLEPSNVFDYDYLEIFRRDNIDYTDESFIVDILQDFHQLYVDLPDSLPERVRNLSQELTKDKETDYEKVQAIIDYLRSSEFTYSKEDVPYPDAEQDYVDQFLFETKQGYCDNFSTAFVVLCRAADIPARWTKGFTAGNYIKAEGELSVYEITNENAHSWGEVYFGELGWVPFEPTKSFSSPVTITKEGEEAPEKKPEPGNQTSNPNAGSNPNNNGQPVAPDDTNQAISKDTSIAETLKKWRLPLAIGLFILVMFAIAFPKRILPFLQIQYFKKWGNNEKFPKAYLILVKQLNQRGIKRGESVSLRQYADYIDQQYNDIQAMQRLTIAYEQYLYGGQPCDWNNLRDDWLALMNIARKI